MVAKVEWHQGELFPRVGFIVTNLWWDAANVVIFYNCRAAAEQSIREGKATLNWTRLSCRDFADNQARLHLIALAYNFGNLLSDLRCRRPYGALKNQADDLSGRPGTG